MRLTWDSIGERYFKAGLDRGVLYPLLVDGYAEGVPWNGLTGVDDSSTGHEKTPLYNDDRKRGIVFTPSEIGGTIKCYTYPDEFDPCIGNLEVATGLVSKGQSYSGFGFSYRTKIGNDTTGVNFAYELHIIYNALITEAKESASTIGNEAKAAELSFNFESLAEDFMDGDPVSHLVINSRFVDPEKLAAVEDILYGSVTSPPRLLLPDELYEMLYVPDTPDVPEEWNFYPHDYRYPSDSEYPSVPALNPPETPNVSLSINDTYRTLTVSYHVHYEFTQEDATVSRFEIQVSRAMPPAGSSPYVDSRYISYIVPTRTEYSTSDTIAAASTGALLLNVFKARVRAIGENYGTPVTSEWSEWSEPVCLAFIPTPSVPNLSISISPGHLSLSYGLTGYESTNQYVTINNVEIEVAGLTTSSYDFSEQLNAFQFDGAYSAFGMRDYDEVMDGVPVEFPPDIEFKARCRILGTAAGSSHYQVISEWSEWTEPITPS